MLRKSKTTVTLFNPKHDAISALSRAVDYLYASLTRDFPRLAGVAPLDLVDEALPAFKSKRVMQLFNFIHADACLFDVGLDASNPLRSIFETIHDIEMASCPKRRLSEGNIESRYDAIAAQLKIFLADYPECRDEVRQIISHLSFAFAHFKIRFKLITDDPSLYQHYRELVFMTQRYMIDPAQFDENDFKTNHLSGMVEMFSRLQQGAQLSRSPGCADLIFRCASGLYSTFFGKKDEKNAAAHSSYLDLLLESIDDVQEVNNTL